MRNKNLRELLAENKILQFPVAHDALSAKLIEQAGFAAVGVGGFAVSASLLGKRDKGNLSFEQMLETIKNIRKAVNIPIIVDAETGFGDIPKTVKDCEEAGVSCIFLEDQDPTRKRCGHMNEKSVISKEDMCRNIELAVASRTNNNFLIAGRTDSLAVCGIEEAIERAKAYRAAGADIVFVEAPQSIEQLEKIGTELKNFILVANMLEYGKTPLLTAKELEKLNYKLAVYPTTIIFTITKAIQNVLKILRDTGTTQHILNEMVTFDEFIRTVSENPEPTSGGVD